MTLLLGHDPTSALAGGLPGMPGGAAAGGNPGMGGQNPPGTLSVTPAQMEAIDRLT